jgi:hypothetical protein
MLPDSNETPESSIHTWHSILGQCQSLLSNLDRGMVPSAVAASAYSLWWGRGFESCGKVIYTTKLSVHIPNPLLPPSLRMRRGRVPILCGEDVGSNPAGKLFTPLNYLFISLILRSLHHWECAEVGLSCIIHSKFFLFSNLDAVGQPSCNGCLPIVSSLCTLFVAEALASRLAGQHCPMHLCHDICTDYIFLTLASK